MKKGFRLLVTPSPGESSELSRPRMELAADGIGAWGNHGGAFRWSSLRNAPSAISTRCNLPEYRTSPPQYGQLLLNWVAARTVECEIRLLRLHCSRRNPSCIFCRRSGICRPFHSPAGSPKPISGNPRGYGQRARCQIICVSKISRGSPTWLIIALSVRALFAASRCQPFFGVVIEPDAKS